VIRVVLDTNVVVSALLKPGSIPSSILQLCLADAGFELAASQSLLGEYEEVLRRPAFAFTPGLVDRLMELIRQKSIAVSPAPSLVALVTHAADAMVLECAIAAAADFLVTGNRSHFVGDRHGPTRIVTPAQFLELLLAGG